MALKIDSRAIGVWRAFSNAHAAATDRIEQALIEAGGVPLSSYEVLLALLHAPDRRLRMAELAKRVVLSRSGLSRLVDRLEGDGLLCREPCGTDRRGAYAVLTTRGEEAVHAAWSSYVRAVDEQFAGRLSETEETCLLDALGRLAEVSER